MFPYENILVPHAGTKTGNIALKHAIDIAKECDATITILSVVEQVSIPLDLTFNPKQSQMVEELQYAPRSFKKLLYKKMEKNILLCKREKINTVIKITHGNPDEEIMRFYHENPVDLIVMAKKRYSKGKSLLNLGSITRKILEHVSCPILIVDNVEEQKND